MKYYIELMKFGNELSWALVYSLIDEEENTEYSTYIEISKELFYELEEKFYER